MGLMLSGAACVTSLTDAPHTHRHTQSGPKLNLSGRKVIKGKSFLVKYYISLALTATV